MSDSRRVSLLKVVLVDAEVFELVVVSASAAGSRHLRAYGTVDCDVESIKEAEKEGFDLKKTKPRLE